MSKRNRILLLAFFSFLFLFVFQNFIHQTGFIKETRAANITVTGFTTTNTTLLATDNTYTFTFTQPTTINPGNSNYYGVSINSNQYVPLNASFCDTTLSVSTDDDSSFSASWGANSADQETGICSGGVVYIGSGVTITAGSTIVLTVTGVKNPGSEGPYYPYIYDSGNNYSSSSTSSQTVFGTPMLQVLVTQPNGSTPVAEANVWIHNSTHNKSAGTQTDSDGKAYFFENSFWVPDGVSVNDTYIIEVGAPPNTNYTDAVIITGVELATGSTVDYTDSGLGPILLTRPQITGTFKVPSGCTTCLASEGAVIRDVEINTRDSSFGFGNFKYARSNESGVFTIGGMSAGTYIIEFRMPWDTQNYLGLTEPANRQIIIAANGSVTYGETTVLAANLPLDFEDIPFLLAQKTITGTVTKADGSPVSSARIQAMKMMESGMAQTTSESNGTYSITLGGGTWMVMPQLDFQNNFDDDSDNDASVEWIYCGMPKNVSFTDDETVETSTNNNFVVRGVDATITGTVTYPNGSPLNGDGSVSVFSKDGCGTQASINWADGTFSASVPSGTYNVSVQTWNQDYGSPASTTVTVSSGTTDIGTLALVDKSGIISGRLWADTNNNGSYDSGEGVGNITVEAFKMAKKFDEFAGGPGGGPMMGGGGDWSMTSSSNSNDNSIKGTFSLKVTNGTWIVNVMADPGMMGGGYSDTAVNYLYTGSPGQANISDTAQTSANNNFKLSVADATIQGRIVDADTDGGIAGIWGYAFAEPDGSYNQGAMMGMGMGSPVNNSSFTLKVPAGDYRIGVDFPPETSGYTASSMATVTAVSGETATVDVPVIPNNATIQVRFKDSAGDLVTDLAYAEVFLNNNSGGHQWKMLSSSDLTSGTADILAAAGDWRVGYHIAATTSNYMSQPTTDNKVTAVANQTVTMDITLQVADSTIAGTVYGPDGITPLPGVWISTDSRKAGSFNPMGGPMFMSGEMTGADGTYSLTLPAGTYQVAAFFPPSAMVGGSTVAYLNPEPVDVTVSSSAPATTNFTFGESDATITGNITLNGTAQGAFITAYSNKGGYNETSSTNGSYSLNVTSDATWYVKAIYESGSTLYYSNIYEVAMNGTSTQSKNLALVAAPFTIPDAVSTTFNCANAKKISLSNGVEISIPASAIVPSSISSCDSTDSSSNITITVSPTAQMSLQDKSVPIGIGYEITAKDSNGAVISSTFNSNVTITIPYTDEQIEAAIGGALDNSLLGNGYWDTSTSTWRSVDGQVIDTVNKTLTISVNHFTLFGILAATDPNTTGGSSTSSGASAGTTADGGVSKPMAPKDVGNIVTSTDNHVLLMLPQGSLKWDTDFSMSKLDSGYTAPNPPLWIASGPYQTSMKTWWNSVEYQDFQDEITLIVRYDPTALGAIPEKSLRLNYYDEVYKRWRPINSLLITDRHEVAAVVDKLHKTYAIIGGYGYQGAYEYADQTVTATSNSEGISLDEKTVSKQEVKKDVKHPSIQDTQPQPELTKKTSFWQKVVNTVKSLFSR